MKRLLELGVELSNKFNGETLEAIFHSVELYSVEPNSEGEKWICRFTFAKNGIRESKAAHGASWLQALLVAVEYVRRLIPDEERRDWLTKNGLPAWIVFPRTVDISWGVEFYDSCLATLDAKNDELQRTIEKKRGAEPG